jgi:hypothetical protein
VLCAADGWSVTPEITDINGLTDELLDRNGVPVETALAFYSHKILAGYNVLAFNAHSTARCGMKCVAGRDDLF